MVSATAEIEAMLAMIEGRQIKCPKCGRSDDLHVVYPDFFSRSVGATLTGGLLEHDDNCYWDNPPTRFNIPPRLIVCGNFTLHDPDYKPYTPDVPWNEREEPPYEWFQYDEDTPFTFGASWADIEAARGLAPADPEP